MYILEKSVAYVVECRAVLAVSDTVIARKPSRKSSAAAAAQKKKTVESVRRCS